MKVRVQQILQFLEKLSAFDGLSRFRMALEESGGGSDTGSGIVRCLRIDRLLLLGGVSLSRRPSSRSGEMRRASGRTV
jgi:hypothetical protein